MRFENVTSSMVVTTEMPSDTVKIEFAKQHNQIDFLCVKESYMIDDLSLFDFAKIIAKKVHEWSETSNYPLLTSYENGSIMVVQFW